MVAEIPWSYVFDAETTSEPPIVRGRAVMFAVNVGCVSA